MTQAVDFPGASDAPMTIEEIEESFEMFDDWEDKYHFVIDLGRDLATLTDEHRTDAHLVRGCQSQVWLHTSYDSDRDEMSIALDSDAHIVRGLICIVLACYQHGSPQQIIDFDIEAYFDRLELLSHLSPTRGNGLRAMITRIRDAARLAAE